MTYKILASIIILFSFQTSCLQDNKAVDIYSSNNSTNTTQNTNVIVVNSSNQIRQNDLVRYEYVVYTVLLGKIYHNRGQYENFGGDIFDGMGLNDVLCYRKETISPDSINDLENNSNISKDLLQNLKQVIKTPKDLADGYDVKAPLKIISGDRNLEKLFPKAEKLVVTDLKYNMKAKAIVGLSRIAFNQDLSQALVYVEYFSSTQKLKRLYCVLPIHKISKDNFDVFGNEITVIHIK